ncbi:MAG TPA: cell envelope integrity protein TolA [Pseudolabrys sp.]
MASAISTGLHAAVLLWALVSFSGKTFEVTPAESLPVDLVSDKAFSEMTKGIKDAPKVEKPKALVEKIAEAKPAEEIAPKLTEKQEVKTTQPKTAEPLPKPDPIAEKLKKQDEHKEAKAEQPQPPKKPPQKQQPKFDIDKIAALLDKRDPTRAVSTGEELNPTPTLGRVNATAGRLSQSEIDAFRRRITDCWSPPVGLDSAQELVVVFRVQFNPDGSVKRGPDVIGGRPSATGPAFAESAKRAILQCQPYTMLRKETYDSWQDMELAFKPSDMFH